MTKGDKFIILLCVNRCPNIDLRSMDSYTFVGDTSNSSILLSHEINHVFESYSNLSLSEWKSEGYCEYVGYGKNIDAKQLIPEIKTGRYIKYMLAIDYPYREYNGDLLLVQQDTRSLGDVISIILENENKKAHHFIFLPE